MDIAQPVPREIAMPPKFILREIAKFILSVSEGPRSQ